MAKSQVCTSCGKDKRLSEYYYSSSPFHKFNKRVHVCKQCIWDSLSGISEFDVIKVKDVLRMIDKPFLNDLWLSSIKEAKESNKDVFGIYMKNIAMPQYRDLTWAESDNDVKLPDIDSKKHGYDLKELIDFFGEGFTTEEYIWLQKEYEDYLNRYEVDSKGMELLIKEICLTQLDIRNRRKQGEKVDTQLKTLQDLLGSSNLKPVQETGANAIDQETFGTLIKKYENEKPIPKPDPEWEDVDRIGKYIRVFFLGHLSRMLGIKNKYENEYWEEINKYTVENPTPDNDEEEIIPYG